MHRSTRPHANGPARLALILTGPLANPLDSIDRHSHRVHSIQPSGSHARSMQYSGIHPPIHWSTRPVCHSIHSRTHTDMDPRPPPTNPRRYAHQPAPLDLHTPSPGPSVYTRRFRSSLAHPIVHPRWYATPYTPLTSNQPSPITLTATCMWLASLTVAHSHPPAHPSTTHQSSS